MRNRLLYVEDERDIRKIALVSLRDVGGFEVTLAASGPEALEKVVAARPDVILLDVLMPGMDGPETLRGLRNARHLHDRQSGGPGSRRAPADGRPRRHRQALRASGPGRSNPGPSPSSHALFLLSTGRPALTARGMERGEPEGSGSSHF